MKDISSFNARNPWVNIPVSAPYILAEDEQALLKYEMDPAMIGLRTELLPVPYVGDIEQANVIFLSLNPGFKLKDIEHDRDNKEFHDQTYKNLTFQNKRSFYFLSPEFKVTHACAWWSAILKSQIDEQGLDVVSNQCMSITYHGYRSPFYIQPPCILPSQKFSFELVRYAMNQMKCIVIMRSKKLWVQAIPELTDYPYIAVKNFRRPFLSKNNMIQEDYNKIQSAFSKI